jgi:hypothetical protein
MQAVRNPNSGFRTVSASSLAHVLAHPPFECSTGCWSKDLVLGDRRSAAGGGIRIHHALETLQYLRASRPILAFLDAGGIIRDVLRRLPRAYLVRRDEAGHAGSLIAALASEPRGRHSEPSDWVAAYSRREIARRFAAVLDAVGQLRHTLVPPVRGGRHQPDSPRPVSGSNFLAP